MESALAAGMLRYLRRQQLPPQQWLLLRTEVKCCEVKAQDFEGLPDESTPASESAPESPMPAIECATPESSMPASECATPESPMSAPAPLPTNDPTPPTLQKMSAKLYKCLRAGDLESLLVQTQDQILLDELTPQQNTALHIVARQGFDELIAVVLELRPDQLVKQNENGELALHLAAAAGRLAAVETILNSVLDEPTRESLCLMKNKDDETSLHVAVRNKHISVARSLVKFRPNASFCLDNRRDSPLSLAAESGELELVKHMIHENRIRNVTQEEVQNALQGGTSVVHSAILGGNSGVLEEILEEYTFLINADAGLSNGGEFYQYPLSCAALVGNVKMVKYILEKFPDDSSAYRSESCAPDCVNFPIHIAAGKGHKLVLEEFLRLHPDSRELLAFNGQNILHVAAKRGQYDVVTYILNKPDFDELINARDYDGNTPLHLAAAEGYPKVVDALTWDNRVRLDLINKEGKSAMDLAFSLENSVYSFKKQLTWVALKYAGAPMKKGAEDPTANMNSSEINSHTATFKDRLNALSVVATLVITVTFTSGFAIPGGNNGSNPDLGKGIFFRVFVISNSIALYMSVLDVLVLIFAMLGDVKLAQVSLHVAVPLLATSLVAMAISFISAVYVVVSTITWLGMLVWVMGSVFIALLLALFFLLSPPILPTNRVTRYLAYPAFKAMSYICDF